MNNNNNNIHNNNGNVTIGNDNEDVLDMFENVDCSDDCGSYFPNMNVPWRAKMYSLNYFNFRLYGAASDIGWYWRHLKPKVHDVMNNILKVARCNRKPIAKKLFKSQIEETKHLLNEAIKMNNAYTKELVKLKEDIQEFENIDKEFSDL